VASPRDIAAAVARVRPAPPLATQAHGDPRVPPLAAQVGGDLLIRLTGADTIAIARLRRTTAGLEGELLISPANARFTYRIHVDAAGGATPLVNEFRPATAAADSAPVPQAAVRFTGDSAIGDSPGGGVAAQGLRVVRAGRGVGAPTMAVAPPDVRPRPAPPTRRKRWPCRPRRDAPWSRR